MDNKTIVVSSLISASFITLAMITPGFFDAPKYFCESRPEIGLFECDGFSKYVDFNGKCLNATQEGIVYSSKICRDGWKLVTDDVMLPEEDTPIHAYPKWERQPIRIETFTNGSVVKYY